MVVEPTNGYIMAKSFDRKGQINSTDITLNLRFLNKSPANDCRAPWQNRLLNKPKSFQQTNS